MLDLKGPSLQPSTVQAVYQDVHGMELDTHVALYTLPDGEDLSKQWAGHFICGFKVR